MAPLPMDVAFDKPYHFIEMATPQRIGSIVSCLYLWLQLSQRVLQGRN